MELSDAKIEKFLIFSQKKAFLIFWKAETLKKRTFLCFSYISGSNFLSSKNERKKTLLKKPSEKISYIFPKKAFLIFQEMELSYISRVT